MPPVRAKTPFIALLIAPVVVALTTSALIGIQHWLRVYEGVGQSRAFTTLFYLGIVLMTLLGGRRTGLWTLLLSILATDYFVMLPRFSLAGKGIADYIQLGLFFLVGVVIVLGTDAFVRNRRLLSQSEDTQAHLRTVMDNAPVGIVLTELDGTLRYANRESERIWGHAFQPVGKSEWAVYKVLDADGAPTPPERMTLARALSGESSVVQREHQIEQPDGTRLWVVSSATLVVDGSGSRLGGLAIMADVSERKQAEAALRAREERFRSLVQNSTDIITVLDGEGTTIYKSPSEERIMGYTPEETIGQSIFTLIHPEDQARVMTFFGQVRETPGSHPPIEFRICHKDGQYRTLESVSANLLHDPAVAGIVVNSRDITDRIAAEQEIRTLLATVQAKADREALLNTIGQAVLQAESPEAILAITTQALGPALSADRCYFVTYDMPRDLGAIGPDWHRAGLSSIAGQYRMSDYGINRDARYQAGQVQMVSDSHDLEPGSTRLVDELGLRSLLRVPVHQGPQMTALCVAMADAPRDWRPDELSLVNTVASQTRVAVDALRLQQREHHIATALQNALMPTLPDDIPGLSLAAYYRPALEESSLGGDFHDVFPLDKGLYALVVGDVSGKGLAAAAQVATVRQMLRYALYQGTSQGLPLAQSLTELNQQTVAHDLLAGFVTLFVAVYDTAASALTYVCCGQEPTLLRRAVTGAILELGPTGPVLGMDDDAAFTESRVSLAPEDALLIYTDGLSEAGRGKLDLLGVEGITRLLAGAPRTTATALVSHLITGMNDHAAEKLHDDVCVLVAVAQGGSSPAP